MTGTGAYTYATTYSYGMSTRMVSIKITKVVNPSNVLLVSDVAGAKWDIWQIIPAGWSSERTYNFDTDWMVGYWHHDGPNILWADGHISWMSPKQLYDGGKPGWGGHFWPPADPLTGPKGAGTYFEPFRN